MKSEWTVTAFSGLWRVQSDSGGGGGGEVVAEVRFKFRLRDLLNRMERRLGRGRGCGRLRRDGRREEASRDVVRVV